MSNEIYQYFMEKYKKSDFTVLPGHWPDFKSKEEVDKWFEIINSMFNEY